MPLESSSAARPTFSIVIPAYNEAARIRSTLETIRDYAARTHRPLEVIVVDDGSTDTTADIVRQFLPADAAGRTPSGSEGPLPRPEGRSTCPVHLLVNDRNRGKGFAVRRGMLEARGDFILMCDADLSAPIDELEKLRPWIERGCDIVIGSRDLPDSVLDPPQPLARRLMAWTFRAIRRRLLLPHIRDTQCGFKLFRCDAARETFSRATEDGWLFDCEALALAERLGYRIQEVGLRWRDMPGSRVHPLREALRALPTLLRIRRRIRSVDYANAEIRR